MVMPKGPHVGSASECPCKFNCETYTVASKYIIIVFSSYMTLLMLTFGDKMVSNPDLSSISSSWVVKDDTTGLVYLDTITTSIGRMVLGSMESSEGPTIEDTTDQP